MNNGFTYCQLLRSVDLYKNTVPVSGDLTIKGVTKEVTTPATIVVKGEVLNATADFSIKLADYGITGVPIDAGKVAKEPKITVSAEFK